MNPTLPKRVEPNILTSDAIGMRFTSAEPVKIEETSPAVAPSVPREKRAKRKNDPKLVAAAGELCSKWLEHVNSGEMQLESGGKYDLTRALPDRSGVQDPKSEIARKSALLLPAA